MACDSRCAGGVCTGPNDHARIVVKHWPGQLLHRLRVGSRITFKVWCDEIITVPKDHDTVLVPAHKLVDIKSAGVM